MKGFPLELGISARVKKLQWLPDGWKSFKIGLVVYTQYRVWQMDGHVAVAKTALCYASRG